MSAAFRDTIERIAKLAPTIRPIVLGALLSRLFLERDVDLTIVGGAAVQYYTQAAYLTKDLDAILYGADREIADQVMSRAGFDRTTSYRHYVHPALETPVEFPTPPLAVASRIIAKVSDVQTEEGLVRIVRIEDIIMDRMTAAVEWKDRASLDQAKLIWIKNKKQIDRKYLIAFAKEEGYLKTLKEVMQ